MIDHALGIAGGARGIVERNRRPFVIGKDGLEPVVALFEKVLVVELADGFAAARRIVDIDDQRRRGHLGQRRLDDGGVFAVDDQNLGIGMFENERHRAGIEADVDGVQHGAGHRHAVMAFQHFGNVGRHHRHGVARPHAARRQGGGESAAAPGEVAV